jgi:hypothetical protein
MNILLTSAFQPNTSIQVHDFSTRERIDDTILNITLINKNLLRLNIDFDLTLIDSSPAESIEKEMIQFFLNEIERLGIKLRFITFKPDLKQIDLMKFRGKGYSELLMVEYYCNNILSPSGYFLKLSARYSIVNHSFYENFTPGRFDVGKGYIQFSHILKRCMTQVYYAPVSLVLDNMEFMLDNVNDAKEKYVEHIFYEKFLTSNISFIRFKVHPYFLTSLLSGSSGRRYSKVKILLMRILYSYV